MSDRGWTRLLMSCVTQDNRQIIHIIGLRSDGEWIGMNVPVDMGSLDPSIREKVATLFGWALAGVDRKLEEYRECGCGVKSGDCARHAEKRDHGKGN